MKKNVQRILATILTVIMMISMLPSNVFAADFDADMFVEPAVEAVSVPAEEQEVESTVEYIYEEPAETLQGSSDEIQTVEAADPAADEIEEETEAPVVDETVTLKAEGSDYIVTLTYDASAGLPAGADIKVKELTENNRKYDDYVEQAANTIDSDVEALNYVRLFDISIVDADGNNVEPTGPVDVQIILKDVEAVEETTQVVHFAGEDEVPEVVETTVEDDTVSFATEGFSIYAVVTSGEYARLEVNFDNSSDGVAKTMYVKQRDITEGKLKEVLYDPGVPVVPGQKFLGWTDNENWTGLGIDDLKEAAKTIDDVRDDVTARLNADPGVTDGDSVTYHAIMVNCFELYYQDEYENTFKTENLLSATNEATTTVDLAYTLTGGTATQNFIGWKVKGTDEPVYPNGTEITIQADTTLVPAIGDGRWLWFDSNAGGAGVSEASYTAPQFVAAGETPTEPADPTRPGYTFDGWFDAPEGGSPFNFDAELPSYTPTEGAPEEESYVWAYAHWTPNPNASYKVIIWAQKVTDDKNAADEAKKYDYVATYEVKNAVAGTVLDETELGKSSNKYFEKDNAFFGAGELEHGSKAFEYNRFEVVRGIGEDGNGVNPDDSTVVNVYYDRALFTIIFTGIGSEQYDYYYPVENGEDVYGLIEGEYVKLNTIISNKRVEFTKEAGNLDLPSSITQVRLATNTSGLSDAYVENVEDLYSGLGQSGVKLINETVGTTYTQARRTASGTRLNIYSIDSTTPFFGSPRYCQLRWTVKGDYSYTYNEQPYTGQLYKKLTLNGEAYTGLYGQTLAQNGYTWPIPNGNTDTWHGLAWLEAFRGNLFGSATLGLGTAVGGIPNTIIAHPNTDASTSTIIFWFEDKDTPGQYYEVDRIRFYFESDSRFNITERILGAEFNGYQWTSSESMPSNWSYNVGNDGFTTDERGTNTFMHVRYKRAEYSIRFMLGNRELAHIDDVKFDQSISSYQSQAPTDIPHNQDQFVEPDWYEDPEGKTKVNWDSRMPAGDKLVYAIVRNSQYHVFVDMDGGTLPAGQRNQFWENWGKTIDKTNFMRATKTAQGDSYTLVGYYLDEEMTRPWNFDIPLSEQYLWHIYRDTADGEDPARTSEFFGEGNYDSNYPQCVGIFRLWAKWRDDNIVGGLHIRYTNPSDVGEGKEYTYEDEMHYEDMVDVIAAQAPTERYWPDGKRFDGWQLTEGKVYQPGDMFIADNDYAVTADDNQRWITLTAVYVDKENRTPTHITWYRNDGSEGTAAIIETTNDQGINQPWNIINAPTREGYTFLGWYKDEEAEDVNAYVDETVPNFLVYDAATGEYKSGDIVVTQVAADEVKPYEGLYAIWKDEQIHIYHSSDGTTEVSIPEKDGDTLKKVDLTGYVKSGYIYGGYYEYDKDDTGDPIHRGTAITSEPGTAVTPEAGKWYYLKEVDPTKYLLPNIYVTWLKAASHELRNFYVLADTDEAQYTNIGVYVDVVDKDGNKKERETYGLTSGFYDKLTVTQSGSTLGEYTTKNIFGYEGVFGMSMKADAQKYAIDHTLKDAEITLTAYYTTLDGVLVTGTTQKKYNLGDQTCQSWAAPGIRAVATGTATPTYGAVLESAGSPAMAYRGTYQLKSEPEISKYTVTKIDNGKTVTQEVQAGDNTGKITYSGKTGYVFAGWYLDKSYKKKADFSAVAGNMTVYAKYVKTSAIGLSFTKKSSKSGSVILNATLKITDAPDITDVAVDCGYNGKASAVKFTGVKTTKSGKTTINTYTGTVTISGLANKKSFTVAISYRTPDGTTVNLADKTCKYVSGSVTVK